MPVVFFRMFAVLCRYGGGGWRGVLWGANAFCAGKSGDVAGGRCRSNWDVGRFCGAIRSREGSSGRKIGAFGPRPRRLHRLPHGGRPRSRSTLRGGPASFSAHHLFRPDPVAGICRMCRVRKRRRRSDPTGDRGGNRAPRGDPGNHLDTRKQTPLHRHRRRRQHGRREHPRRMPHRGQPRGRGPERRPRSSLLRHPQRRGGEVGILVYWGKDCSVEIRSASLRYPPRTFDREEIDRGEFRIIGRVVHILLAPKRGA